MSGTSSVAPLPSRFGGPDCTWTTLALTVTAFFVALLLIASRIICTLVPPAQFVRVVRRAVSPLHTYTGSPRPLPTQLHRETVHEWGAVYKRETVSKGRQPIKGRQLYR
jgi:hypothetical protein